MKRSEFGKIARKIKEGIDEEKMWGMAEVMLRGSRGKQPAAKADKAEVNKTGAGSPGSLAAYKKQIEGCTRCPLGKTRINFVFGVGNPAARLMFVGEGPGYDEDRTGEPFVGRAGQLLTKIIEAMGMRREDVYIANIVKCHPMIDPSNPDKRGNDRPPTPEESAACLPYLEHQIDLINPAIICTLGNSATRTLLKSDGGISRLRGRFVEYRGIRLMPTYHPAALLRNPSLKKDVWEDMKKIVAALNAG
jgi:DNA polymerase